MSDPAAIRLPRALVPADGRFGSGPSKVRPEAVAALTDASRGLLGTSHRRDGVTSIVHALRESLAELFGLADGYEVVLGATSAAGGLRVDPAEFDAYYFAPQKAFGSEGGLWFALCSPAAIARIERIAASDRWQPPSLSLANGLASSRRDETYNTPALATLFLMRHTTDWMLANGGLEWAASRCDQSAEIVYGWAESRSFAEPFVAKPSERSRVTATIDFVTTVDAAAIATALRANGIVDVEPYRKLGRNQLRIGMFPAVEPDDVATLTNAIDYIVDVL